MEWKTVISWKNTTAEYLVKLPYRDRVETIIKQTARIYRKQLVGDHSLLGSVHEYEILDGLVFRNRVFGWYTPGLWINSANVVRFVFDQLNIQQPDLLPGESELPNLNHLRQQVISERAIADAEKRRQRLKKEEDERLDTTECAKRQKERVYKGTPTNYEGLNGYEVCVLREIEHAAKLHRCGYLKEAQKALKEAIGLRKRYDAEITPQLKYKRQFGETEKMRDLRLYWDPSGILGRRRRYSPWLITNRDGKFNHCGVWAPTFVKEFCEGKRPGRTWGSKTLIEVTDEDYEKWPYLIRGYPDRPDTIEFVLHADHVYEWPTVDFGPDWQSSTD